MEKKTMDEEEKPLLETTSRTTTKKGGFKTLPFITANEGFEKMATYGLNSNMTIYLMKQYHMEATTTSNILFFWSSATSFMTAIGAVLADSYLGQFLTIGFGSIIFLVGLICLWLTAIIPQTRPPPCDNQSTKSACSSATFLQFLFLCTSFVLMSTGAGGIRSSSLAFGANQIDKETFEKGSRVKESYFAWYYVLHTVAVLIGLTAVVYVQDNMGWGIGFTIPVVLMFVSVVSFHLASPFYVKLKNKTSLITGLLQVIVASYKKRNLKIISENNDETLAYHLKSGSNLAFPSSKLRCLNKACIVQDPENELSPDGTASDPWLLCTVDQVEDLKSLLRIAPIWSSGFIMSVNLCQTSFPVLIASSMDRHVTSSFEIPAASFNMFLVISVIIWVAFYDRVFIPLASRALRRPFRISPTKRMGFGIFLSFVSVAISSIVESIRRKIATDVHKANVVRMSAMWLIPQYCLLGISEALNGIGQNEFFYSELPKSMSSIATSLFWTGTAVGNLIASLIMNAVDGISKLGGRESWVSSDINKGHYDYYYLVLAGLSLANMVYYVVCCKSYGPTKGEKRITEQERDV